MTIKTILPSGPCPAKIMLVADSPLAEELATGVAFSGYTMQILTTMMAEAGISMQSCYKTHVLKIKAPSDVAESFIALTKKAITFDHVEYNGRQVLPILRDQIQILKDEIARVKPNVIVALGNVAMWALTGQWGLTAWRGSVLRCTLQEEIGYPIKVIPTYHPRQINKVWKWRVIGIMDLVRIKRESQTHTFPTIDYDFLIEPTFEWVNTVLSQLIDQANNTTELKYLSVDIETKYHTIEMIALAWNNREAICIPFVANNTHYYSEDEEAEIVYLLYRLLTHKNIKVIGQNFNYDDQYIHKYWMFTPNSIEDTLIIQHSMTSVLPKDLSFLSSMYLPYHKHWKEDGKGDPPLEQRSYYNCEDAAKTYAIWQAQQAMVDHYGLRDIVHFQLELWPHVQRMTHKGVLIDKELRKQYEAEVIQLIKEREEWLEYVLGYMPNIQSPAQMAVLFYEDLLQKQRTNRKTGNLSTDDEALTKIAEAQPLLKPLVRCISELRSLGVFLETFIRAKLSSDGRLRCSFKITGTTTYRFASTKDAFEEGANLQNIPDGQRSTIKLPNVRKLFIPDEGHTFFDVDLDSADIRIVAWESECTEMIAMLNEGKKVYVEAMKEYYKDPTMTKHHPQYVVFKALCHGTNYLGTAKGLAGQTGLITHEVEKFQQWYYGKFPEILDLQNSIKDQVMKRKQISNVFGYRMLFFDRIEGTIFNEAVAWKPQSTVACIINRALVTLQKKFPPNKLIVENGIPKKPKQFDCLKQVHDSLTGQFPTEQKDYYIEEIKKATEILLPYRIPLTIPAEVHTSEISWGHCK
jgi:DNA polymerase I-like protein with 3'-5' exonuclease and polymerase domains/uracil-DNA glycosylase